VALLLLGLGALAPSRDRREGTTHAGYSWACLCAAAIAANTLLYKVALVRGADVLVLFTVADAAALPIAVLGVAGRTTLWPRVRAAWSEMPVGLLLASVASSVSFLLSLYVMRNHGAAWVLTLRNSSIAFAQLLSWVWLGEKPSARILLGVSLVFGGALLLGF
jgi:drug/metabolite transporter (DMT)-like permease